MKNITKFISVCLIYVSLLISNVSFSQPINRENINQMAVKWHIQQNATKSVNEIKNIVQEIIPEYENQDTLFYILNYKDGGFVILSADSAAIPVLGYSHDSKFDPAKAPPQLLALLKYYKEQILYVRQNKIKPDQRIITSRTQLFASQQSSFPSKSSSAVYHLTKSEWNQGAGWDNYCPYDVTSMTGNNRAFTGCVATAMAQILRYWNYPIYNSQIPGYVSTNYGLIGGILPTYYDWKSMDLINPSDQAALLSYHCGVSVDMIYGPTSSGAFDLGPYRDAQEPSVYYALTHYFGYLADTSKNDLTNTELKIEIDNGRPVLYGGFDNTGSNGHTFIIDGYEDGDLFHINWGWGGYLNSGAFAINDLTPATNNFSFFNDAVYNIRPNVPCDLTFNTVSSSNNTYQTVCRIYLEPGFSSNGYFRARAVPKGE